jgi:hypothetical protein
MNRVRAKNLLNALKEVKITKISKTPILNHARLQFEDGYLVMTSTDMGEVYQAKCPAIMDEEWATCVPMQNKIDISPTYRPQWKKVYPFMDFVAVCAEYDDVLELTFEPTIQILTIKVQGERSTSEFKCLHVREFPSVEL